MEKNISVIFSKMWLSLRRIPKGMGLYALSLGRDLVGMPFFLCLKRLHLKEKSHIYVLCSKASLRASFHPAPEFSLVKTPLNLLTLRKSLVTTPPSFSTGETYTCNDRDSFHLSLRSHCVSENTIFCHFLGEKQTDRNIKENIEKRKYCLIVSSSRKPYMLCRCRLVYQEKKWGQFERYSRWQFFLSWRNWLAMTIPLSVSTLHFHLPLILTQPPLLDLYITLSLFQLSSPSFVLISACTFYLWL